MNIPVIKLLILIINKIIKNCISAAKLIMHIFPPATVLKYQLIAFVQLIAYSVLCLFCTIWIQLTPLSNMCFLNLKKQKGQCSLYQIYFLKFYKKKNNFCISYY